MTSLKFDSKLLTPALSKIKYIIVFNTVKIGLEQKLSFQLQTKHIKVAKPFISVLFSLQLNVDTYGIKSTYSYAKMMRHTHRRFPHVFLREAIRGFCIPFCMHNLLQSQNKLLAFQMLL